MHPSSSPRTPPPAADYITARTDAPQQLTEDPQQQITSQQGPAHSSILLRSCPPEQLPGSLFVALSSNQLVWQVKGGGSQGSPPALGGPPKSRPPRLGRSSPRGGVWPGTRGICHFRSDLGSGSQAMGEQRAIGMVTCPLAMGLAVYNPGQKAEQTVRHQPGNIWWKEGCRGGGGPSWPRKQGPGGPGISDWPQEG